MLETSRSKSFPTEGLTRISPRSDRNRTGASRRRLFLFVVLVAAVLIAQGLTQVPAAHGISLAGSLNLCPVQRNAYVGASFIDSAHGYAYFGVGPVLCGQTYGTLFKVRLSNFTVADHSSFLNHAPVSGLFDPTTGFAYLGTGDAELYKVNATSLAVVAEISAGSGAPAVIDPAHGFAYFGCGGYNCITRTNLADFLQEGSLTTPVPPRSAVIDVAHGFAYFAGESHVMKIRLSDFTVVNDTVLPSPLYITGINGDGVGAIDPLGTFAYFGGFNTATSSSILLKIGLANVNLVSVLNLTCATCLGETPFTGVIDSAGTYAYFQLANATVVQVRLSDFTVQETLGLPTDARASTSIIDSANGFAYFPADCCVGSSVWKISIPAVTGHADSTTVNCDPSPVVVGKPAACHVTVIDASPGSTVPPSGSVSFHSNNMGTFSSANCIVTGTGNTSACSVSYTPTVVGTHTINATYTGDQLHSPSSGIFSLRVIASSSPTSLTLFCSPSSMYVDSAGSVCTATVTDTSSSTSNPTGTVTFSNGGASGRFGSTPCSLQPILFNAATCSISYEPTAVGSQSITGNYPGDSTHQPSTSTPFSVTVTRAPTSLSASCSPGSEAVNSPTTCALTVTQTSVLSTTSPYPTPTGPVSFTSNGAGTFTGSPCTLFPVQYYIASCTVTYTPTSVGTGTHTITAVYPGDTINAGGLDRFALTVTAGRSPTSTTISCDSPVVVSQGSICNATVTDASTTGPTSPAGTVRFSTPFAGAFDSTSCTLIGGAAALATCHVAFTPSASGTANISGTYTPTDTTHDGSSTTTPASITVDLRTTSTSVACSPGSVLVNQPSTCVATVMDTSSVGNPLTPSAQVSFTASGSASGTFSSSGDCTLATRTTGTAGCSADFIPSDTGTVGITASYSPMCGGCSTASDPAHSGSTSTTAAIVTVGPRTTSTIVDCSSPVTLNTLSTCNITVRDTSATGTPISPAGAVGMSLGTGSTATGTFGSPSCTLARVDATSSSCVDDFTGSAAGNAIANASYAGDPVHSSSQGSASVTVTPPAPSFDYTLLSGPTSASAFAGSSVTATVTAILTSGTAQPVTLTLSIFPNPPICQTSPSSPCGAIGFSPTIIAPTSTGATSILTISTTTVVQPGTYTITITGIPQGKSSSSAVLILTIIAPSVSTVSCGHDLSCSVRSNSTLSSVRSAGDTIHFEATGSTGTQGYANVTVPKSAIPQLKELHVFVNNAKLDSGVVTVTSNSTAYFIYFTFTFHSSVQIDIQLTAVENAATLNILGLDPKLFYTLIGMLVVIVVAIAAMALRKRKMSTKLQ